MRKKFKSIIALLCILMFAITGCSTSSSSSGSTVTTNEKGEKEIIIGIYKDAAMEEMDAASYNGPHFLYKMIYEGFVEDGGEEGIVPQLATDWKISEDGKTYTFKLREGVKFSDGSDFDADNVVFNMNRWINNERHAALTSVNVESVEAVDKYTVKVVYEDVAYPILTELTYPRPVRFLSENAVKEVEGDPMGEFVEPIGTGQWMFESYTKDQEFTLVPNPYYWGEKPQVDRIRFKVITDAQARLMALKSGEIDLIGGDLISKIPMENIKELSEDSTYEMYTAQTLCSHFMYFNQDNEWFQDKNVRLAFNYAIDKETMVESLFNGVGSAADGLYQKATPYATDENNYGYKYDLDKAKSCLKEAGFEDSDGDGIIEKDGKPFEIDLVLSADEFPEWKSMSEYIQSELLEVGIKVNLNILDANGYEEVHMKTKNFDVCILRTASDSWVPHSSLKELFMPLATMNGDVKVWDDETLQKNIQVTLKSMDEEERQENYDKVFGQISEEALTVPLYYPVTTFAVNKDKISNFEIGVNNYAPVNWTTLDCK